MHSPRRFALAGTLDEYGDIRSLPNRELHSTRSMTAEARELQNTHQEQRPGISSPGHEGEVAFFSKEQSATGSHPDLETDMFQWPFIDASWSVGFDAGLDGLWHHSGLFDPNSVMR
jgi:hypothetical protein